MKSVNHIKDIHVFCILPSKQKIGDICIICPVCADRNSEKYASEFLGNLEEIFHE